MKKMYALAIVPFAITMIGAQDCVFDQIGKPVPPPPPQNKPWCLFDPPVGCLATCIAVDLLGFSGPCNDISASTLTVNFENAAQDAFDLGQAMGTPICTAENVGKFATPCRFGIEPQPNPPESQDVCMNPPLHCGGS